MPCTLEAEAPTPPNHHESTSTDWLRVTIGKPIAFYREFGEDSEFFSDCLATQKELQESELSSPRFLSLIKNKRRSKNETIDGELEESGRSGPRFLILIKNQKEPQNQTIVEKLEKRGCSGPRFFILLKNRKDPKNETARELKGGTWRTPELNVMYSVHCTVQVPCWSHQ